MNVKLKQSTESIGEGRFTEEVHNAFDESPSVFTCHNLNDPASTPSDLLAEFSYQISNASGLKKLNPFLSN